MSTHQDSSQHEIATSDLYVCPEAYSTRAGGPYHAGQALRHLGDEDKEKNHQGVSAASALNINLR